MNFLSRSVHVLLAASVASGCAKSGEQQTVNPTCISPFRRQYSADSGLSICLPPRFTAAPSHGVGAVRWERGDIQAGDRAWLSITVDRSDTPSARWPPQLASAADCKVDCMTVDSAVQHTDTAVARTIISETGLATGGIAGFQRQPLLFAGWILPGGGRVWANGFATRGAALDTLRAALATVMIGRP